jgi:hypothetical protein
LGEAGSKCCPGEKRGTCVPGKRKIACVKTWRDERQNGMFWNIHVAWVARLQSVGDGPKTRARPEGPKCPAKQLLRDKDSSVVSRMTQSIGGDSEGETGGAETEAERTNIIHLIYYTWNPCCYGLNICVLPLPNAHVKT